ncbi:MAG: response regulator transcription factor [Opitutae bacterium]|nr:response regulator transcription factor [Opitutae bacterium]
MPVAFTGHGVEAKGDRADLPRMRTQAKPLKVLLVDDEAYFRHFVGKVLGALDRCSIVEAHDGQEAIAQCQAGNPDLILLDINMPRVDGVQALPKIRALNAATPIVMLTSVSEEAVVEECVTLGASYFIRKDVPADRLLSELQEVLRMFFPLPQESNEQPRTPTA